MVTNHSIITRSSSRVPEKLLQNSWKWVADGSVMRSKKSAVLKAEGFHLNSFVSYPSLYDVPTNILFHQKL